MRRKRGIVLITTLILVVMIVMLLTAATTISRGTFGMSESFHDREAALWAANCGVQYAMTRLRERPRWKGDATGLAPFKADYMTGEWAAGQAGIQVREDHGNVVGMLRTPNGGRAQFRIRFNWQDGAGPPVTDGLTDPTTPGSTYMFKFPYVSVNNLGSASGVSVPRGDAGAGNCAVPFPLTTPAPAPDHPYDLGPYQVLLIVEGRSGNPLNDVNSLDTPDPVVNTGYMSVRYLETILEAESTDLNLKTVIDARNNVEADLGGGGNKLTIKSTDKNVSPDIRTYGQTTVTSGTMVGDPKTPTTIKNNGGVADVSGTGANISAVGGLTDGLAQLQWTDVDTADKSADVMNIKAGTYVYQDDGSGKLGLFYFQKNFDDATLYADALNLLNPLGDIENNRLQLALTPGTPMAGVVKVPANFAGGGINTSGRNDLIEFNPVNKAEIKLKGPVYAEPQGGVNKFAVLIGSGDVDEDGTVDSVDGTADSFTDKSKLKFEPLSQFDNATLSSQGSINLYGGLEGAAGSITAGYDDGLGTVINSTLTVKGAKTDLASTVDSPVNLYATDDIKISTVETQGSKGKGKANDLKLRGVIYTWGDFTAELNDGSFKSKFDFTGSILCYGGSPSTDPGTGLKAKGKFKIDAEQAVMSFNPAYLNGLTGVAPGVGLKRLYAVTY